MLLQNLIKKLNKFNIEFKEIKFNELNRELEITINNKNYYAMFNADNNLIHGYYKIHQYADDKQETERFFYNTINDIFRKEKIK